MYELAVSEKPFAVAIQESATGRYESVEQATEAAILRIREEGDRCLAQAADCMRMLATRRIDSPTVTPVLYELLWEHSNVSISESHDGTGPIEQSQVQKLDHLPPIEIARILYKNVNACLLERVIRHKQSNRFMLIKVDKLNGDLIDIPVAVFALSDLDPAVRPTQRPHTDTDQPQFDLRSGKQNKAKRKR